MNPMIEVLVLEDHGESLALLHAVLEPAGMRLTSARSTEEAMRLLLRDGVRPDVILSDLILPGQDGLVFLRWLRAEGPLECRTGVGGLAVALRDRPLFRVELDEPQRGLPFHGERVHPGEVRVPRRGRGIGVGQAIQGELADGLEQAIAHGAAAVLGDDE